MLNDNMTWSLLWHELSAWSSWTFEQPNALWLAVLAPAVSLIYWVFSKRLKRFMGRNDWDAAAERTAMSFRHSLIERMHWVGETQDAFNVWRVLLQLLRWGLLFCVVVAIAQPVKKVQLPPEPQTKTVRDLVFVLESSASFLLTDYQIEGHLVSRMNVMKSVLDQFVSSLQGNRFSFIVYAEHAFSLMPLTSDAITARLMLKRLRPYLAGRTDEAAGAALGLALQQTENQTKTTQKKVVIFISDGQTRPSTIPFADDVVYAQKLGVPIYTIGVGAGSQAADKRQYSGLLYQPLKSNILKQISAQTGGRYYQVDGRDSLQKVLKSIDRTEGVKLKAPQKKTAKIALYPYLIALALMLFVVYFALVQLLAKRLRSEEVA